MSTKRVQARLERLEVTERERELYRRAERLAARHGVPVDEVMHMLAEITDRINRWGLDAEVMRMAQEYGKSEEELWADYEAILAEMDAER